MKCLPVVILALVVIAAESKVLPASDVEPQQTETQSFDLSEYVNRARTQLADQLSALTTQLQQHIPNQDEIVNTLKEESSKFASNIQSYVKNVTDEVKAKTPELENLWTDLRTKLSDISNNLNVNPETTEQVNQLQAKFKEGIETLMKESANAANAVNKNSEKVQESISKFTKEAVDIAVQASQNLNNQLQQLQSAPAAQP